MPRPRSRLQAGEARTGQYVRDSNRAARGTIRKVYLDWHGVETVIIDYDNGERWAALPTQLVALKGEKAA